MGGPGPGSSASSADIGGLPGVISTGSGYAYPSDDPVRSAVERGVGQVYDPNSRTSTVVRVAAASFGPKDFHNFDAAMDPRIISEGMRTVQSGGYTVYSLSSSLRRYNGAYEPGGFMNAANNTFSVTHRFFRESGQ
jgi:hypothetical protein